MSTVHFVLMAARRRKIIRSHVTASALGRPVIRIAERSYRSGAERRQYADRLRSRIRPTCAASRVTLAEKEIGPALDAFLLAPSLISARLPTDPVSI
jgi:hypothetical protein